MAFRERECKLNAPSRQQIEKVWNFVLSDAHYVTDTDRSFREPWLAELRLSAPQERTALRERVYCDNRKLVAARHGIDIRLEDPSSAGKTKQMVKMPAECEKAQDSATLDRMEYSFKMKKGKTQSPDLTALPDGPAKWVKKIFEVSSLKDVNLYPLLQIVTQRSKMHYYPNGDRNTKIELAMDIGRGRTCFGDKWPVFQIELEMVKGDPDCLNAEGKRLTEKFDFLSADTRSKSTPGFELLGPYLADKDARELIAQELKGKAFQVLSPPSPKT